MHKTIILLALLVTAVNPLYAQKQTGSVVMTTKPLSENQEMRDLMRFNNLDYYQVNLTGEKIKGKNYSITVKEIWKGKIKSTDVIFNSATRDSWAGPLNSDVLPFRIMAAKSEKEKIKLSLFFDRFGINKEYKSTASDNYSLRDFGTQLPIEPNKPFYAFAYILPTEHKDGSMSWCEVDSSGKDIEKWGQEFGIEHYLLIEMNFFE